MAYKHIPPELHQEWKELHSSGRSIGSIARQYGVSHETVSRSVRGLTKPVGRPSSGKTIQERRKAFYQANRERLIEKAKARYRANRPKILEYQRLKNHEAFVKSTPVARKIIEGFEQLPEIARPLFARIVLLAADTNKDIARAIRGYAVDYHWLGAYAGV